MDQRKKCADICDVAQVTNIRTHFLIDVNLCQLMLIGRVSG